MNFKRVAICGTIIFSALVLSACNLYKTSPQGGQTGQTRQTTQTTPTESAATITFADTGIDSSTVTIKSGEAITWTNNSSKSIQVASDNHPTHTLNQELSNGQFALSLAPGESKTVSLTKTGTWGYHDHLSPSVKGKVVVQ